MGLKVGGKEVLGGYWLADTVVGIFALCTGCSVAEDLRAWGSWPWPLSGPL